MTTADNRDQYEAWNGESGQRWVGRADQRDGILAPIADVLLDSADIGAGARLLDVGCGCGATSLAAAARVGNAGHVTGLDLSRPMLEVANERARRAGATNVAFIHGDAQSHQLEHLCEGAISRFGTMFFADPVAAFTNIRRNLAAGGWVRFITWQPLAANQWLTVPRAALLEYGTPSDAAPVGPGMFAQSDPGVIRDIAGRAGFGATVVTPRNVMLRLGSVQDAADYLVDSGPVRATLECVPTDQVPHAVAAIKAALQNYDAADGVYLEAAVWMVETRV